MPQSLATYIALPGTTGEAMEHWHEIFGGELNIMRYGDAPPMEGMPFTPDPKAVAHSTLVLPGGAGVIAGGDAMDSENDYPVRGTAYSLLYTTDTPEEAQGLIQKLVDGGGEIGMPFERAPWGDWYGQVFDRFGVMWAFSCASA
ncbi:VOC family protein [Leucobacter tenebrionis]|uniref:VOC family protein n=1 Tax=Leucobacter tenebrionis TaxID=2873270 RepID=UPI001CA74E09|nr:VOC family protein [Leucobacter tenebrionis]QZY51486.1 VOC family protein [Leucobacter tenebrionis]